MLEYLVYGWVLSGFIGIRIFGAQGPGTVFAALVLAVVSGPLIPLIIFGGKAYEKLTGKSTG
jgi:hypothetical protein